MTVLVTLIMRMADTTQRVVEDALQAYVEHWSGHVLQLGGDGVVEDIWVDGLCGVGAWARGSVRWVSRVPKSIPVAEKECQMIK